MDRSCWMAGIAYLIAGLLTLFIGVDQFGHDVSLALGGRLKPENAHEIWGLASLLTAVTVFFIAMGSAILARRCKWFVIVGAAVSCLLVPIGTVPGLVFLLWTRRNWLSAPTAQPKAE